MLYILKTDDYLKNLTDYEVEDFVVINFGEYFKCTKEKLCSKLNEERNVRKVPESLYLFLTAPQITIKFDCNQDANNNNCIHRFNEILNLFDSELQLNSTKPMITNKLKAFLSSGNISLRV